MDARIKSGHDSAVASDAGFELREISFGRIIAVSRTCGIRHCAATFLVKTVESRHFGSRDPGSSYASRAKVTAMDSLGAIQEIQEQIQHHYQLTNIAVVVLAALACGLLMLRLRQPALVGYILAGVDPRAQRLQPWSQTARPSQLVAELGVLMLLFLIGMELSLRGFREVWKIALTTTLLQIVVGLMAMTALSAAARLERAADHPARLRGRAVLAPRSRSRCWRTSASCRTRVGQITVGVLIAQDLAVVPMMLIVGSFGSSGAIGLRRGPQDRPLGRLPGAADLLPEPAQADPPALRPAGRQKRRPDPPGRPGLLLRRLGDLRPARPLGGLRRLPGRPGDRQLDRPQGSCCATASRSRRSC